jgi:hypothetical protein
MNVNSLKEKSHLIAKFEITDDKCIVIYDCNGNKIKDGKSEKYYNITPKENRLSLVGILKKRYLDIHKEQKNSSKPVVWILLGKTKENEECIIQVGSNKNIFCMFDNDLRVDIIQLSKFQSNIKKRKRYSLLWNYDFEYLAIYKVDDEEINFEEIFGKIDQEVENILNYKCKNNLFDFIYLDIRIKFIEGFLAQHFKCKNKGDSNNYKMWNPSPGGYDGFFYKYFEGKTQN